MDLMAVRRRALIGQKRDNKIWLIKDGVDVTKNTGGYECSTRRVSGWNMSGWTSKMPVLTQEDGFLRLSLTGSIVYGSLVPQKYLDDSKINGKTLYLDSALVLSKFSYFHLSMIGDDGISYGGREIKASAGYDRRISSTLIWRSVSDTYTQAQFPIQISTRNTSYVDIYNLWIE